jgi:hypothetical protein
MKFAEKYELLESLTTGAVETFFANDKVRGERVLVHILRCDPRKPNQPTVQWVLEAFRRLAPEPTGLVLETGPYSGTLYAYLVTKLPDDAALRAWVQQYEARPRDTQEVPAPVPKRAPESAPPPADVTPKQSSPVPGPVTQLLRSFELPPKPGAPSAPTKPSEPPSQASSNIHPAVDRSLPQTAPIPAAPERDPVVARPSVPPGPPDVSRPVNPIRPNLSTRNIPSEVFTPPVIDKPKPGEFTSVFQGPFHGDAPSDMPALSPQKMEPPRKTVGDFTAMFGAVKPGQEETSPASGLAGNETPGTGFTGFFNADVASRNSSTSAPTPPILPAPQVFPTPQVFPAPQVFPTPQVIPAPPSPNVPTPPVVPSAQPPEGATGAFSSPASKPAPSLPPMPSGPSAYTQIISLKNAGPAADPSDSEEMTPATSAEPPAFPPPAMPALPKSPKLPPLPKAPAPKMPAAKMPKLAMPSAPKPPKVDIPSPPPVSYWPLILTLTVLFFIAVLLVLYFVLKH